MATGPRFKAIYYPNSAFGGWEFRATSNGIIVNVQAKAPLTNYYRTLRVVSRETWNEFAKENLYDPAESGDPSIISRFSNPNYQEYEDYY